MLEYSCGWWRDPAAVAVLFIMTAIARTFVYAIIAAAFALGCHEATAAAAQEVLKAPPLQPWQERRAQLDKTLRLAANGDAAGLKQFEQVLVDFDSAPFARTPIENLEIFGAYYLPNQGAQAALPSIVTFLVLGWYDTLRFASSSGKAEIANNEQFFDKAFVLVNPDVTAKARTFLQSHPQEVAKLVAQGFGYAEKSRELDTYDRRWPSAYGLERVICASGGDCKAAASLPKEQWDKAWLDAKNQVSQYFNVKPTAVAR